LVCKVKGFLRERNGAFVSSKSVSGESRPNSLDSVHRR
jgi:hypothetical protein